MKVAFLLLATLFQTLLFAQNKFTINGYVRDSATGETVIGATVSIPSISKAISTNQYGYYSVTLEKGDYELTFSHVSYFALSIPVALNQNHEMNVLLNSKASSIDEVVVYSRRKDANVKNAQMGKIDLSINQIKSIPAFMGEVDILKTIQL